MRRVIRIALIFWLLAATAGMCAGEEPSKVSVVVGNFLPGEGGSPGDQASPLKMPFGVDFDRAGNMFIAELEGGRVHRLDAAGDLTTLAGDGEKGYRGDGSAAGGARFNGMHNVAVTPEGDIYVADSWNHCIRKIAKSDGVITTIAGTGEAGFSGDGGPAKQATFNYVMCITLDHTNEKLYVADLKNLRIRVVTLETGLVHTVAGNGEKGAPTNGALATDSPFVDPRAVAVDSKNRVYVLERSGHSLRLVDRDGTIRTVAGTGTRGNRDGPALQAELDSPKHLCVDDEDNVIIADERNALIRKYDPQKRTLTTILGQGRGTPAVQLSKPHGVCIEKGLLYVVDTGHDRILSLAWKSATR